MSKIKTGDHPIVDNWVNNIWPETSKSAIKQYIPDYQKTVKFRTSTGNPSISNLTNGFQLVINYNYYKECYIVWNAAIQSQIHSGKKYKLSFGKKGEDLLQENVSAVAVMPFYRNVWPPKTGYVELILIVGKDAIADFCKNYQEMIKPDSKQIEKGKRCLYAVSGGEIQYIPSEK